MENVNRITKGDVSEEAKKKLFQQAEENLKNMQNCLSDSSTPLILLKTKEGKIFFKAVGSLHPLIGDLLEAINLSLKKLPKDEKMKYYTSLVSYFTAVLQSEATVNPVEMKKDGSCEINFKK